MNCFIIETPRTKLAACNPEILEAALSNNEQLGQTLQVRVPERWTHFNMQPFEFALQQLRNPEEANWWTYFSIHKADNMIIGTCGYKGKPDEEGMVEIGYEIIDAYKRQGFATEVAQALIRHAFNDAEVAVVQAHTLAEKNASVAILKKCGMEFIKELMDEEDGALWQWRLEKEYYLANNGNKKNLRRTA